jgi:hypothetical protein
VSVCHVTLKPNDGKVEHRMKELTTAKDLILELKKAGKRQGSPPPGFHDWVMITQPLEVRVTRGKFEKVLEFIEKLAERMPGFGVSFSVDKSDLQAVDKTLGLVFFGQWFPIMIREGYVEDKKTATFTGTGVLTVEIGEHKRWIESESQGDLITQIHLMLEGVHVEGGQMFSQEFDDKKVAEKLERQRVAELELVHSHWVNKAVAGQAEEEAQSWQRAQVIREYSAELLEKAQDNPKSIKRAKWLGNYADRIDPLSGDLPEMPELKGPFNWDLQR